MGLKEVRSAFLLNVSAPQVAPSTSRPPPNTTGGPRLVPQLCGNVRGTEEKPPLNPQIFSDYHKLSRNGKFVIIIYEFEGSGERPIKYQTFPEKGPTRSAWVSADRPLL